ncbi:MAG: hypothetical protein R2873_32085 [Caldilineaceae bacterium]
MATFLQRKVTGYHNRPTMAGLLLVTGLLALAWVLATGPLSLAALLVFGGGAMLLVVRFPWLAWIGLAVALPFSSAVDVGRLSVTDLLLVAALAIWFADGVRRRSLRLDASALAALTLIYVASC